MALAVATTAATIAATLGTARSASVRRQAHKCAPAGVEITVSATSCSRTLLLVGADLENAERLELLQQAAAAAAAFAAKFTPA